MAIPRLANFWDAMKTRLNSARMQQILEGSNHIYRADEDYSQPPGTKTLSERWGRLVIIPPTNLWEDIAIPGETRRVNWFIRTEVNSIRQAGYNIGKQLEAAQDEAHVQLDGWSPTGLAGVNVIFEVYRWTDPQPLPLWDPDRGLFFLSSEYRCEVA